MRGLLIAAWVACLACDEGGGSTAGATPDGVAQLDGTVPPDDAAPVPHDTREDGVSPGCAQVVLEDRATLGRDDAQWCFEPLEDGAHLEIVRGIQGGIHVELRLAVRVSGGEPGADVPTLGFEVEIVDAGATLARFSGSLVSVQPLDSDEMGQGASSTATACSRMRRPSAARPRPGSGSRSPVP